MAGKVKILIFILIPAIAVWKSGLLEKSDDRSKEIDKVKVRIDPNSFTKKASKSQGGISQALIIFNGKNKQKINGLWTLTETSLLEGKEKKETTPSQTPVYIQLRRTSTVWMTEISAPKESEIEYSIASFSSNKLALFQKASEGKTHLYKLKLSQLDAGPLPKVSQDREISSENAQKPSNESVTFELKEARERANKQVIGHGNASQGFGGSMTLENDNITNFSADINGKNIELTYLSKSSKNNYIYKANDTEGQSMTGKIRAMAINANEFNIYFISGAYRGYTLIYARQLSDNELYQKESLKSEEEYNKLALQAGPDSPAMDIEEATILEQEILDARWNAFEEERGPADELIQAGKFPDIETAFNAVKKRRTLRKIGDKSFFAKYSEKTKKGAGQSSGRFPASVDFSPAPPPAPQSKVNQKKKKKVKKKVPEKKIKKQLNALSIDSIDSSISSGEVYIFSSLKQI